ncbi:MAG: lytic transglycosylase domain-containing protein [Rikenellaceae bacterium]
MKFVFLLALSLTLFSTSCIGQENNFMSNERMASPVIIPEIPQDLDFAGERVPIENYDTRESLEEDIMVTMYLHSRTMTSLRSSKRYFSIIEPMLKEAGIPDDFKYLAVAESSLNPEAYSPAKAAGLWQIMATTGRENGLEVNSTVDERYHIEKATKVAIKYLKTAKAKFGNWAMAAASYNVGMAGVSRRATSQGVTSYYDLFAPAETMRYVFRILSFKIIFANPQKYGYMLNEFEYYSPYEYTTIKVSGKNIKWSDVAKENGTTYKIMRELNPWIRTYDHPNVSNKTYEVKIPTKDSRKSL